MKTQINRNGEDMKGKFGRILGDFEVEMNGVTKLVTDVLVEEGHAVPYYGGSKDETKAHHMLNRKKLMLHKNRLTRFSDDYLPNRLFLYCNDMYNLRVYYPFGNFYG